MPCYHPLRAYRSLSKKGENGKPMISLRRQDVCDFPYEEIDLPCGGCIGCQLLRSKEWSIRCVHEASLYSSNCFITLTFDEEHINDRYTLVKSDFQKFMKRLRFKFVGVDAVKKEDGTLHYPIRFFHCGEYGSKMERPHHHACLFNFDFFDKYVWKERNGVTLYRSERLEELWPYGFCTIGDVTPASAAYVARYVTKKVNGKLAEDHYKKVDVNTGEIYELVPEYITMSRRPGIGKDWFGKFSDDVFPKDFITHDGRRFKTPRYYDKIYDITNPSEMDTVKLERSKAACRNPEQKSRERLAVKKKVQEAKAKKLVREYER